MNAADALRLLDYAERICDDEPDLGAVFHALANDDLAAAQEYAAEFVRGLK